MSWLYVAFAVLAAAQATKVYTSPDGAVRAVVRTGVTGEAVEFQAIPKRRSLLRESREYAVIHAAWTPDSQYFVASTEATGGHQPWARPIWFYSRARNQVFELGKLGATAVADFTLKAPDVMQTKALDCERPLIISLHQLAADGRLLTAPCAARR